MNAFKLITSSDGTQHAIATADGIRYDMYLIGGEPLPFKIIERATAAATAADNITEAAQDSLAADGIDINAIDVIVTADEATATTTELHPYSLNGAAASLIDEHAAAISDILHAYEKNTATTAVTAHADAIRNITRTLRNRLKTV